MCICNHQFVTSAISICSSNRAQLTRNEFGFGGSGRTPALALDEESFRDITGVTAGDVILQTSPPA